MLAGQLSVAQGGGVGSISRNLIQKGGLGMERWGRPVRGWVGLRRGRVGLRRGRVGIRRGIGRPEKGIRPDRGV